MKRIILNSAILSMSLFIVSCKQSEKLPPPVSTVEQARTLVSEKVWQVTDVATISGSRKSIFDNNQPKNETVVAPAVESLNWLGSKKEADNQSEFLKSFYEDKLKISIAFNNDSIATATGMDAERQLFSINNNSQENEPKGIKLTLTGESKAFADMGASKFTATYYILGASEKKLYLLTPNKLNDLKVVFLLETK